MSDWASSIGRVVPGLKVGLFIGPAAPVDELVRRSVSPTDHVITVRPPLSADSLGTLSALPGHQVLLIRGLEESTEGDWALLDRLTAVPKVRGLTILLTGESFPQLGIPDHLISTRNRVGRQGVFIEVRPPNTELSRRWLVEWFAEECKILVPDARVVCQRVGYSIEDLVWALRVFRDISGGAVLPASTARRLLALVTPQEPVGDAYWLTLNKRREEALRALEGISTSDTLRYLHLLESALTDIALLQPVISTGVSWKLAASRTGLHVIRVLELAEVSPRYPESSVAVCRQALSLGLAHSWQPEAARTVALLWR